MKKNSTLKLVLAIVGGVVVVGAMVVALIHFWEDIKKLLPCCKEKDASDEFEEFDDIEP